jgi:chromosome segregation ATPase
MGYILPITIGILTGAGVQFAFFRRTSRHRSHQQEGPSTALMQQIADLEQAIRAAMIEPDTVISTASYASLQSNRESITKEVQRLQDECERIAEKLKKEQSAVQELELTQQALKTARAEDEAALEDIRSQFSVISEEAAQLELQLANSQQQLEDLLAQVELTKPQRQFLEELQQAMRTAGETLRQLLEEYREVQERLGTVTNQQEALELEYTTLVEKLLS